MARIEVQTITTYELGDEFLWPDGENAPTATKAKAELLSMMNGCDVQHWLCSDLIDESWTALAVKAERVVAVEVEVPNPAYSGDDTLFGDPPPKTLTTRARL